MTSYGSIWLFAAANVFATSPHGDGLLYLADDGALVLVQSPEEAPPLAHYVCRFNDHTDPLKLAARLAFVACDSHH